MSKSAPFAYVSFDRVPSPKGAAVHIREFVKTIGREFGAIDLITPNTDAATAEVEHDRWPGVQHYQLPAPGSNLIQRAMSFRGGLEQFFTTRRQIVHFRSIFEGYPLATNKSQVADRLIFEVNGLPSIELKYHHPDVADDRELLRKLRHQEDTCLDVADRIITPSAVTAAHLITRGVADEKISVIANGVHPELFSCRQPREWPAGTPTDPVRMLYAGTFSPWQGVRQAIDALHLFNRDATAQLTVIGPTRGYQRNQLENWCRQSGVADNVQLVPPLSQRELAHLHHDHDVVIAPLLANDRNTVQGCCPLKVLEAMASGVPLIASDLPVVRALARPEQEALLVRPGSGKAIKDAMMRLGNEPGLGPRLATTARERVEKRFTWARSGRELVATYRSELEAIPANISRSADTSPAG